MTTDLRGLYANSSRCHGPGPFCVLACLHIGSQRGRFSKRKAAGKRSRLLGRGHFATNMALLLLFVHGTRCPFLPLLLPRSVLCSLQYVAEKKSSECCFLCCVLCRWAGLTCCCCPPYFCFQTGATRALTQPISGARYRTTCVNCLPRGQTRQNCIARFQLFRSHGHQWQKCD